MIHICLFARIRLKDELCNVIDLIQHVFKVMGFEDFTTQLSFRDDNTEKYGGDIAFGK